MGRMLRSRIIWRIPLLREKRVPKLLWILMLGRRGWRRRVRKILRLLIILRLLLILILLLLKIIIISLFKCTFAIRIELLIFFGIGIRTKLTIISIIIFKKCLVLRLIWLSRAFSASRGLGIVYIEKGIWRGSLKDIIWLVASL